MPYFTRKRPITVPYTLASLLTGTPPEIFNQSFIPGVHTPITFFVPVNYRPDNTYETTKKMTTPSVSYDTTVVPPEREPNPPVALDAKAGSSASHGKNQQSGAGEQQHENSAIKEAMLHPVKVLIFIIADCYRPKNVYYQMIPLD